VSLSRTVGPAERRGGQLGAQLVDQRQVVIAV
jgi:hypothetical protein